MPLAFQKVVAAASATASADWKTKPAKEITVMVVGCTGYIGKFVTKELISRGYNVIAVSREKSGVKGKQSMEDVKRDFAGAQCRFADVTDLTSLKSVIKEPVDVVVSCLASRTGGKKDSWLIDYQVCMHIDKSSLYKDLTLSLASEALGEPNGPRKAYHRIGACVRYELISRATVAANLARRRSFHRPFDALTRNPPSKHVPLAGDPELPGRRPG